MPTWTEADQTLAKGIQRELGRSPSAASTTKLEGARRRRWPKSCDGGGSDDIGDVSWNVPTVTLRYPSNIPGLPGHNWANAISMATPIAHKGVTAGAKVQAMTMLDILTKPAVVEQAWDYFRNVQTKETKYQPAHLRRGQAGDLAEQEDHGRIPRPNEEVLLRSREVRDLSRAARGQPSNRLGRIPPRREARIRSEADRVGDGTVPCEVRAIGSPAAGRGMRLAFPVIAALLPSRACQERRPDRSRPSDARRRGGNHGPGRILQEA